MKKEGIFKDLIETLPHPLVLVSNGVVIYANPAFYEMLLPDGRLEGVSLRAIFPFAIVRKVEEAIASGGSILNIEGRLKLKNRERRVFVDVFSLSSSEERLACILVRDVSQLQSLAEKRDRESIAVVSEELVRRIFSTVHPLAISIITMCNYLKELGKFEKEIELIKRDALRLKRVVEEAVDFTLSGKKVSHPVSIYRVLDKALEAVRVDAVKRGVSLIRDYLPGLPEIEGDPLALYGAFLQLMKNAVESVSDGGTVRVSVGYDMDRRLLPDKGVIRIEISDTGPEIPEGIRSDIFLPFFTTKDDHLGLGLSRAYKIIKEHEGDIEYRRSEGKNIFLVYLPL